MPSGRTRLEPATTLADVLDRVIDTGVVAAGEVVLSVADVDLVYLNLRALLGSVETLLASDAGTSSGHRSKAVTPNGHGGAPTRSSRPHADVGYWEPSRADAFVPISAPSAPRTSASDALEILERFAERVGPDAGGRRRINTDPENVERGLAGLILTVVDLLRELMERQAIRRMQSGSIDADQVERLGRTFYLLDQRLRELKNTFGLEGDDLGLGIGVDVQDLG